FRVLATVPPPRVDAATECVKDASDIAPLAELDVLNVMFVFTKYFMPAWSMRALEPVAAIDAPNPSPLTLLAPSTRPPYRLFESAFRASPPDLAPVANPSPATCRAESTRLPANLLCVCWCVAAPAVPAAAGRTIAAAATTAATRRLVEPA